MKVEFSRRIFEESSNIEFHENSSGGSRVVPCGRRDGQTDMTKLTVAVRNSVNAPEGACLTFWRWNYFFNFRTPKILNVNNTGTKYVRIIKQTAF